MRPSSAKALQLRYEILARRMFGKLPLAGALPRIEAVPGLRDRRGPVHGAAFLRQRRVAFDCTLAEFPRIFVHEMFHFAWLRAGNAARRSFEELLRREWAAGAGGELGWSAEWRKRSLTSEDVRARNRRWREYCCESFCDTAGWLYSGSGRHSEFTLARGFRLLRQAWFVVTSKRRRFSI